MNVMNRKNSFLFLAGIVCCFAVNAQQGGGSLGKNAQSFYGEVGGPGIITVNYDQRLKGNDGFGFRAGMGGYGVLKKGGFTVPVGVNYITGSNANFAEIGAGLCYVAASSGNTYFDNTSNTVVAYFNFGYRFQPVNNGLTYRIFLSPLLTAAGLVPFYGGASVGIKF